MLLLSFLEDLDLAHRTRSAREWFAADDRRRVVGLVIASIAMSLVMSLLATALVGFIERRRAPAPVGEVAEAAEAAGDAAVEAATPEVESGEPTPA